MAAAIAANVILFTAPMTILTDVGRFTAWAIHPSIMQRLTGVLRPFVFADIERDYDLNWDLTVQRKLEAEYSQKPVLITNSVFPAAED